MTDFFSRQDHARKQSRTLLGLMALSVVGVILTIYLLIYCVFVFTADADANAKAGAGGSSQLSLFDPVLFGMVAVGCLIVMGTSAGVQIAQLAGGGDAVAGALGGRLVTSDSRDPLEQKLLNLVEEMSIASGVPVPKVYLLAEEQGINAFAAGYRTDHAVVAVTQGALEQLNRDELQGVIAHEFSHILNGDMRLNIRLIGMVAALVTITQIGFIIMRTNAISRSNNDKGGGQILILAVGLLAIGAIGSLFGNLIKSAISRQREYLADASAVQFTRNPTGIADALKKIGGFAKGSQLQSPRASLASHMYFSNGIHGGFHELFATHPPLEERIRRLDPKFFREQTEAQSPADETPARVRSAETPAKPGRTKTQSAPPILPIPGLPRMGGMGGAPIVAGLASGEMSRQSAAPRQFVNTIGRVRPDHMEEAASLLGRIPAPLRDAARDPFSAQAVIFALMLSDDNTVLQRQLQMIEQNGPVGMAAETRKSAGFLAGAPTSIRLPLVELCHPNIRSLHGPSLQQFRTLLAALAKADEQISLFEYMLSHMFDDADTAGSGAAPRDVKQLAKASSIVLSALARQDQGDPSAAFAAAKAHWQNVDPRQAALLVFQEEANCNLDALHGALTQLKPAPQTLLKPLLESCVASVQADGRLSVDEAELLRAIVAALRLPAPPILNINA